MRIHLHWIMERAADTSYWPVKYIYVNPVLLIFYTSIISLASFLRLFIYLDNVRLRSWRLQAEEGGSDFCSGRVTFYMLSSISGGGGGICPPWNILTTAKSLNYYFLNYILLLPFLKNEICSFILPILQYTYVLHGIPKIKSQT